MNKTYIHYGHKHFVSNDFVEIKNNMWNKPIGGLWASDINAEYGWKNWCKDEEFCECNEENSSVHFRAKIGFSINAMC